MVMAQVTSVNGTKSYLVCNIKYWNVQIGCGDWTIEQFMAQCEHYFGTYVAMTSVSSIVIWP